jgi:uncharacterized membrane protein YdbT with pleckstrin-like domain
MDPKESSTPQGISLSEKVNLQQDVKSLWERWDKAQKGEAPSELVKGYNLVGVIMLMVGALFQSLGSGFLKLKVAPILILVGAVILAVKKFKALWYQRSLNS